MKGTPALGGGCPGARGPRRETPDLARRVLVARLTMSGPHDLFVRYTFGHPERAAAELCAVLPAQVVSEVDWASLRRESGSVVDPELRETESDLLFTARLRTGHPLLVYVLLEHQSSVDVVKTQTRKTLSASRFTAESSSSPGASHLRA